ncbi:MAG: STAS domain-containing protein [Anaerolineales bacterium]|nr:STAS domain-containing protein [Anaerolineales bacterium]
MSELIINVLQVQGDVSVTILQLAGKLDRVTSNQMLDRARQAREDGARHLLLDLSGVEMLTSSGLVAIQSIFKLFTPESDHEMIHNLKEQYKSPHLKLVCPDPKIYYILNIAGFLQSLLIYNNLQEALNSFSS